MTQHIGDWLEKAHGMSILMVDTDDEGNNIWFTDKDLMYVLDIVGEDYHYRCEAWLDGDYSLKCPNMDGFSVGDIVLSVAHIVDRSSAMILHISDIKFNPDYPNQPPRFRTLNISQSGLEILVPCGCGLRLISFDDLNNDFIIQDKKSLESFLEWRENNPPPYKENDDV